MAAWKKTTATGAFGPVSGKLGGSVLVTHETGSTDRLADNDGEMIRYTVEVKGVVADGEPGVFWREEEAEFFDAEAGAPGYGVYPTAFVREFAAALLRAADAADRSAGK